MKKKIEDALRTEYAGLGLSDKTIGRLADFLTGSVEKEEDIATAVKRDDVKLIAKSIQGEIDGIQKAKKKAEDDLADYKAKHPEASIETKPNEEKPITEQNILDRIAQAVSAAVNPLTAKIEALEKANSTKAALETAREAFFSGDYAKKYKEEANDAWDRAVEINELTGNKMTAEQLTEKVNGYFNKAVSRKGVDTSKPFVADPPDHDEEGTIDWSAEKKRLQDEGRLPKDNQ